MERREAQWREFCTRWLETKPFKLIYTDNFNMRPLVPFAERVALGTFREILHPDFDEFIRSRCLEASGKVCCELFLKYSGLNTDTDIDSFLANLAKAFPGQRKLERKGNVIQDEYLRSYECHAIDRQCGCPIIRSGYVEPTPLMRICCTSAQKTMFEAVVKHPVKVELLDSPLCTGSNTCRWLIRIEAG